MVVKLINIKIIDTHENNLVLEEQFAEHSGIQFLYNGSDDRFSTIVASELHWNMLSPNSVDGYFLYLFTGNETHFKVILEDFTDPLNPVALWTGHLLPEQFNEPYTGNAFFCTFIATDGLGRIKTKKLDPTFYNVKKGISVVFADCLKQTGLNFPIFIAPAIVNAVTNLNYGQIAVNTASYVDKDKNLDPYTILEKLLTSMGCKLFQWKEYWYVIGINRMTETTIECEEYDANGVYIKQTIVDRPQTDIVFYEAPTISVQPSFKTVTIDWDKNQDKSILPKDITYQLYSEPILWFSTIQPKHWIRSTAKIITPVNAAFTAGAGTLAIGTYYYRVTALNANGETLPSTETSFALASIGGVNVNWGAVTGATGYKVYGRSTGAELLIATVGAVLTYLDNGSITPAGAMPTVNSTSFTFTLASYTQLINFVFVDEGYMHQPLTGPLPTEDPFNLMMSHASVDNVDVNYISLENPIYIESSEVDGKVLTLDIEFKLLSFSSIITAFNAGNYANSFKYELLLDDVVLVSNKPTFTNWEGFDFELTTENDFNIIGRLNLKSIPIHTNGLLDLKISAPVGVTTAARMVFKKIEITYDAEDETLIKERNIDFTTSQTVDIFHGDDNMDITDRQFLFTDDVTFNEDLSTPASTQQIPIMSFYYKEIYLFGALLWTIQYTLISIQYYWLMKDNIDNLYIKRLSTGVFEKYNTAKMLFQLDTGQYTGPWFIDYYETFLVAGDEIWLMVPTSTVNVTNDVRYLRERWRRYEHTETIRYTEALARIYHDTVKDYSIKISGVGMGFYNPLELLNFKFIDGKQFMITNCSVDIDLNETTLDLVETSKNNVTDYVDQ